jgi:hypothetical protein
MTMAMSMKSKRAGDCTGAEDVKPQPLPSNVSAQVARS